MGSQLQVVPQPQWQHEGRHEIRDGDPYYRIVKNTILVDVTSWDQGRSYSCFVQFSNMQPKTGQSTSMITVSGSCMDQKRYGRHGTLASSESGQHRYELSNWSLNNYRCIMHSTYVSQQKATRLVAPLTSPQSHGPLSAVRVLIYGLARPMR